MLSEDANERSINLAVRITKLTGSEIKRAIEKWLANRGKGHKQTNETGEIKQGRTTLKELSKSNDGLSTIELKQPDLRLLNSIMKKHGVRFAVAKDGKGMYTLFFKGKDIDSVTHAFEKYAKSVIKRGKECPSITKALAKAKVTAQTLSTNKSKEKNRNKGGLER